MLSGADLGFRDAALYRDSLTNTLYVIGLDALQVLVAAVCFGLIRPWGEIVPRWVPWVGGTRIHRLIPTVIGTAGVIVLWVILLQLAVAFGLSWWGITDGWTPDRGMSGGERALLVVAYVPFFIWPAAVSAAIVGYWKRRAPDTERPH